MSRVFSEFERGIIAALKNEGSTWNQIKVELFTRYNRNILNVECKKYGRSI